MDNIIRVGLFGASNFLDRLMCDVFIKNPHFFIWSDNFKDIEKYFKGTNFTYIQGKDIKHDFYLFQFAKHFIVSPSTFHWWGAWLNSSVNKTCLRPKDINPSSNVDFWPDKWIAI